MRDNNGEHRPREGLFNIRIEIPGVSGKPSPTGKLVAMCIFYALAGALMLATGLATLGVTFVAGFTYSKVQDRIDAPLRVATIKTAEDARTALEANGRYLSEVRQLYPVAIAAGERTEGLLQARAEELQKLQVEAAALQGKLDAESLRKLQELRKRLHSMPALASSITWRLMRENFSIGVLAFLAAAWLSAFLNFAGPLYRVFLWIDRLGRKKVEPEPAAA